MDSIAVPPYGLTHFSQVSDVHYINLTGTTPTSTTLTHQANEEEHYPLLFFKQIIQLSYWPTNELYLLLTQT